LSWTILPAFTEQAGDDGEAGPCFPGQFTHLR
jgi:hypothetical protein